MPAAWVAAAGALVGGLSSASQSGGGQGTSAYQQGPWVEQHPYFNHIFTDAKNQYLKGPMQYYPKETVAGQSPFTQASIGKMAGSSLDPNSLTNQSLGEWSKTVAGDYLKADSNPYLKGAVDDALGQVQGRVAGLYGARGGNNYASSAHEETLGRNLAATALPMYAQNYQQERARQLNAAQLAPGMEAAGYAGLQQAGQTTDAYQQSLINADKARFDFQQQSPWDTLQRYQSAVTGNYGNIQTSPYFKPDPLVGALGGAATGLGFYNQYQNIQNNKNAGTTNKGAFAGNSGWDNTGDYNSGGDNGGWGYA